MIVIPMVFRNAIKRRSTKDVRPTDVLEFVGPADLFIEKLYLCKKVYPTTSRRSNRMNLFKQVRAVSRDDTLHTCLRRVLTEKKRSCVPTKSGQGRALHPRCAPYAARTHSHDEQEC